MSFNLRNKPYPKGRRINNLLVFDLTLLFSLYLQILCIASVTEMIFKCGEGKIRRSKAVSYLYGVPKGKLYLHLGDFRQWQYWRDAPDHGKHYDDVIRDDESLSVYRLCEALEQ